MAAPRQLLRATLTSPQLRAHPTPRCLHPSAPIVCPPFCTRNHSRAAPVCSTSEAQAGASQQEPSPLPVSSVEAGFRHTWDAPSSPGSPGSITASSEPLEPPARPLRPKTPSAAAIQAANDGHIPGAPDSNRPGSNPALQELDGPSTAAGPSTPHASIAAAISDALRDAPHSTAQTGGGLQQVPPAAQLGAAGARKVRFDGGRAGRDAGAGMQRGRRDGRGEKKRGQEEVKKKMPVLRTTDRRCIVKVSNDTSASQLATAMFRILMREQQLVLVFGGLHPVYTACRALALANLLMNNKRGKSVSFTPLWIEGEDRRERLKVLQYQVHVGITTTAEELQDGDVSKVLDFGEEAGGRKGLRGVQEDRAHHVADILVSAVGEQDDAMIMAATHTEVVTSFHAIALCQRRLSQESCGVSPSCTAYFEMLVTGDPNKKGILFYAEPIPAVTPAQVPSQTAQKPAAKAPSKPISLKAVAA